MLSTLICAVAHFGGQQPAEVPVPLQVTYRVKLYDRSGLVAAPRVRTLDGQQALIGQKMSDREFKVIVLPRVNRDLSLTTELNLSIDGCNSLATTFRTPSAASSYIKISETKLGKSVMLTPSLSSEKPRTGPDDFLIVVTGTVLGPTESDPFTAPPVALRQGDPAPAEILFKVVVRDSKGVVTSPVVRTLNNYAAHIYGLGNPAEFSIGLIPSLEPNGDLLTVVKFTMDGENVSTVVSTAKQGSKKFYKVWKEDAATPRVTPLSSSHHVSLKPGEWLVEVAGSVTPHR